MRRWPKICFERMAANRADFTLTFRRLCDAAAGPEGDAGVRAFFADPGAYDGWAAAMAPSSRRRVRRWAAARRSHAQVNPAFIPRNHLVEAALDAASRHQDFQPFEDLLRRHSRPYDERPELERYSTPARPEERVLQTFCGT